MTTLAETIGRRTGTVGLGFGLLALAVAAAMVAHLTDPLYVPLAILAVVGGILLVARPYLGILIMFASVMFKPEALQGRVAVNTIMSAALLGILLARTLVVDGFRVDFLRSPELRVFILIGVVILVNWLFWGSEEAPQHLAMLDQTERSLERFAYQFLVLTFALAFIRTPGQLLALVGLFLVGLLYTLPGALSRTYGAETRVMRAAAEGTGVQAAENANRLAFLALLGVSMIWFYVQERRSTLLKLLGTGVIFALVLAVLLSGSRSGFINLLFLGLLLLFQSKLRPGHIAAILLLALLVAVVGWALVPDPIAERLLTILGGQEDGRFSGEATASASRRVALLEAGLRIFRENPLFGIGVGNFRWTTALDPRTGGLGIATHNNYILVLAEGGAVLLAAYLLLFVVTLRNLNATARLAAFMPDVGLRWLVLATRTNILLLLVFALFAESWKEFYFVFLVETAAVLGMLYRRAQLAPVRA